MFGQELGLERLRREMDSLFRDVLGEREYRDFPLLNVWANENDVVVTAELPGVDAARLDVSVVGDTLTLRGERAELECGDDSCCLRRERATGAFLRTLQLPFRVDSDQAAARITSGILTLTLPRAAEDRPRKIDIRAN